MNLTEECNGQEEESFARKYTCPTDFNVTDENVGIKEHMMKSGFLHLPFKFVYGMQRCKSQFKNKEQ
jgi:hypothetical protein